MISPGPEPARRQAGFRALAVAAWLTFGVNGALLPLFIALAAVARSGAESATMLAYAGAAAIPLAIAGLVLIISTLKRSRLGLASGLVIEAISLFLLALLIAA
jgi:hypothetical protein